MGDVYRVRGGVAEISDDGSTTSELLDAAKEVKELGTVDASFSRGELHLLDDEVVFAPGINESTVANFVNSVLSKGPIDLVTLGIYDPYASSLEDADQYAGSWRLPYADVGGVSLLSKGNGYEIFLRRRSTDDRLYRIRVGGMDPIGFRWLYSPNHDTSTALASELFDRAGQYGEVEAFDAGGHFPVRTKTIAFPKGETDLEPTASTDAPVKPSTEAGRSSTEGGEPPAEAEEPPMKAGEPPTEAVASSTDPGERPEPTASSDPSPEVGPAVGDETDADGRDAGTADTDPDVSWLDSPGDPDLVVENASGVRQTAKLGVRIHDEPEFAVEVDLPPGETYTTDELPGTSCQIGVITADGRRTVRDVDPTALPSDVVVTIAEDRIDVGVPTAEEPEPLDSERSPKTTADRRDTTADESTTDGTPSEAVSTGEPTRSSRSDAPRATLYLLGLGVVTAVVVPFTDWPFLMEVIRQPGGLADPPAYFRAMLALFPSLLGSVFGYGASVGLPGGPFPVSWPVMFLLAAVIPVTLLVDVVWVRRRTEWTPSVVLYPLGAVFVWFVTIPLYVRRRRAYT